MKRHVASLELFNDPIKVTAADVNLSGSINATDILKVQRRSESRNLTFDCPDWFFEKITTGGNTVTVSNSNIIINFKGLCAANVNGSYIPLLKLLYTSRWIISRPALLRRLMPSSMRYISE